MLKSYHTVKNFSFQNQSPPHFLQKALKNLQTIKYLIASLAH